MGGGGKKGGSSGGGSAAAASNPYIAKMANMAEGLFNQTAPLRTNFMSQAQNYLSGRLAPDQMTQYKPLYATARQGLEDQYNVAKQKILENVPRGGGTFSALGNLEASRAGQVGAIPAQISSNLISDLQNKIYGAAWNTPQTAMSGMGGAMGGYNNAYATGTQYDMYQQGQGNSAMGALGSGIGMMLGGGCCFIFIEADALSPVVRRYRDEHMTVRNRRGYCWLADRLVPRMRRHKWVKWLVKRCMTDPMTSYGKWVYGENRIGILFAPITYAWLGLFSVLGFRPPYTRIGTQEVV